MRAVNLHIFCPFYYPRNLWVNLPAHADSTVRFWKSTVEETEFDNTRCKPRCINCARRAKALDCRPCTLAQQAASSMDEILEERPRSTGWSTAFPRPSNRRRYVNSDGWGLHANPSLVGCLSLTQRSLARLEHRPKGVPIARGTEGTHRL